MMDIEYIVLPDETPEADAMEQRLAVDVHNDTGLDTTYVDAISDRDANPADVQGHAWLVAV